MPCFGAPPPLLRPHPPIPLFDLSFDLVSLPLLLCLFPFLSPLSPLRPSRARKRRGQKSRTGFLPPPEEMELFYELLLTAAVTLLAALLLATLFAANDSHRRTDRAAAAIAEEVAEEERIIEVDEVMRSEGMAAVAPSEADGWVEAEKAPAVVVAEVKEPESLPEEEGVPVKAVREVRLAAEVEEGEDGGGGVKRPDLTSATVVAAVGAEASQLVSGAEVVPKEVSGAAGLEERTVQDVVVNQYDLGAEVALVPVEVLEAGPDKQGVEVVGVAQVPPLETEAAEVKQHHLVAEAAPAEDVLDVGLVDKSVRAIEVRPNELDSETVLEEILDAVLEEEEQVEHELPAGAAPQPVLDVPLAGKGELKHHQPVEEAAEVHEDVQCKQEAECEAQTVDQQQELVPEEESVAGKNDDVNVIHECSFSDEVVTELPVGEVTSQGLPKDDPEADMEFEEWEGIERSEVEKRFGAAAAFAASGAGAAALSKLDSDVQLQLQGLLKVAIDGPCYDSAQPLTLRPSSRAKWRSGTV
ncbi:acyl-CoA-binding domain-containing protein 5 isoform X1 [Zea mays]|uniref:acyl-CoA-binding domain-containing protein 5 isoform X1 n=1 Tax=Zea mays TaxID=4577 RepID=UPI0004DEB1EB|nr:uncharacterized protein LOC100274428 isoform X1 [Zea mays]|eukprot:XP_008668597.1 uncharacterized protein LOC100274428 isoform X1 [Zea mays]